jgi:maleate isomerase
MYGWRTRIGLLVPSVNTVMESELGEHAPEGVSVHAARMGSFGELTVDNLRVINDDLERGVELLAPADVDIVVYGLGIMPGSVALGAERDDEIADRIEAAGVPGTSSGRAIRAALDALGAERIAALTPYTDEINEYLAEHDDGWGFEICSIDGFGVTSGVEIGANVPEAVYRQARAVDVPEADAVVIGGTNQRSVDAIPRLEADLGKPVVSANQATLWHALDRLGVDASDVDLGTLFDQ